MGLHPVTFRYTQSDDKNNSPLQYGLIVEEVAKVLPDLVLYGEGGKPAAVHYPLLTPLLLKELQDQQAEQDKLLAGNKQLVQEIAALDKFAQNENQELIKQVSLLQQQITTYAAQMATMQVKFNSLQQLNRTEAHFTNAKEATMMLVGNQ